MVRSIFATMFARKRALLIISLIAVCLLALFMFMMKYKSDMHLVLAREVELLEKENKLLHKQVQQFSLILPNKTQRKLSQVKEIREVSKQQFRSCTDKCECDTINIAVVAVGYSTVKSVVTVVKSILFYRHNPLHFHFLTDRSGKFVLRTVFATWKLHAVNLSFYSAKAANEHVAWISNSHYSGVFGLMKLTLPSLLPTSLQKVIVLDTDLMLISDILDLWRYFEAIVTQRKLLGIIENQSNWYLGNLWDGHKPWPALGRGFNTGVMLFNLELMRAHDWSNIWNRVATRMLMEYESTALADQDIINTVLLEEQDIHYVLPCFWNAQLSEHSLSDYCTNSASQFKLVHWNSPQKRNVNNPYSPFFRSVTELIQNQDGYLYREALLTCNSTLQEPTQATSNDPCIDFRNAKEAIYRTHPFIIDYKYEPTNDNDVTLVTQMSMDRLHMLDHLCLYWTGPISIAVYATDPEIQDILNYVSTLPGNAENRLALHVVYKSHSQFYPVNYIRNVALSNVNTPYVFLSDIDFIPMAGAYEYLLTALEILGEGHRLFVVPAFETYLYKFEQPHDKEQLLKMIQNGTVSTFRSNEWKKGHAPTNYEHWKTTNTPYKIKWAHDFEPYIVAPSNVTRYDERFAGFGWNKVSHIMELNAQGYTFVILPSVFMIHMPHSPSPDINRFRKSKLYRDCVHVIKTEFKEQLEQKYTIL